eukprot:3721673-Rhodomonas_salina.2
MLDAALCESLGRVCLLAELDHGRRPELAQELGVVLRTKATGEFLSMAVSDWPAECEKLRAYCAEISHRQRRPHAAKEVCWKIRRVAKREHGHAASFEANTGLIHGPVFVHDQVRSQEKVRVGSFPFIRAAAHDLVPLFSVGLQPAFDLLAELSDNLKVDRTKVAADWLVHLGEFCGNEAVVARILHRIALVSTE